MGSMWMPDADANSGAPFGSGDKDSGTAGAGRPTRPAILLQAIRSVGTNSRGNAYARFRNDPLFLLKYYLANLVALVAGSALLQVGFDRLGDFHYSALWLAGLMLFVLPNFYLIFLSGLAYLFLAAAVQPAVFTPWAGALVPTGVLAGTVSAALMHNAAHGNFRPRWSNRPWGELCGLFQLTGFAGWAVSHVIHHMTPDDPAKDAHPPGRMTFTAYANSMGVQMKENITANYFELHGRTERNQAIWDMVVSLVPFTRYARVLFIMLLLGPVAFLWLYVPFKIANALIYIDFNYRTHRPRDDGSFEVLNLNHTIWYKMLNAVSFGSYFHKNHHGKWNVFNPRDIADSGTPLITYRPD